MVPLAPHFPRSSQNAEQTLGDPGRHRACLAGGVRQSGRRDRPWVDQEIVRALDLASGQEVWRAAYPAPYVVNSAAWSHGAGPKATPAIAGGRVFTLGIGGILSAFDLASGTLIWRVPAPAVLPRVRRDDVAAGGRHQRHRPCRRRWEWRTHVI